MIVNKTSVFPASRDVVFEKLQRLETLQHIAKPYVSFEPVGEVPDSWKAGAVSSFSLRLFSVIPYGTHTIRIVRLDPDGISSREGNEHVPVWNHDIRLTDSGGGNTQYTDRVEIHAGWKTLFIWLWADMFYAHRQRKWIRMLTDEMSSRHK